MKVIGITQTEPYNQRAYVCIVSHEELAKVADKAHYNDRFPELKVGQEYNLGEGHDFRAQLTDAIRKMSEAYTAFAKVAPVAAEFAGVVAGKKDVSHGQ